MSKDFYSMWIHHSNFYFSGIWMKADICIVYIFSSIVSIKKILFVILNPDPFLFTLIQLYAYNWKISSIKLFESEQAEIMMPFDQSVSFAGDH